MEKESKNFIKNKYPLDFTKISKKCADYNNMTMDIIDGLSDINYLLFNYKRHSKFYRFLFHEGNKILEELGIVGDKLFNTEKRLEEDCCENDNENRFIYDCLEKVKIIQEKLEELKYDIDLGISFDEYKKISDEVVKQLERLDEEFN